MSKKTMKILTTIATILLIISMGTSIVAATSVGGMELSPNTANTGDITTIGNKVMGLLFAATTIANAIYTFASGMNSAS